MDLAKYHNRPSKGPRCTTGFALATLPDDKAAFLRQLIDDPQVTYPKIEEFSVEDFGVRLPASSVARHARGQCACA